MTDGPATGRIQEGVLGVKRPFPGEILLGIFFYLPFIYYVKLRGKGGV